MTGSDALLTAIREWTRRDGEPPTMADWDPARARRLGHEWRIVRYQAGDWPSQQTARNHFGSLNAAVEAAGLQPRKPGQHAGIAAPVRAVNRRALAEFAAQNVDGELPTYMTHAIRRLAAARLAGDDDALHASLVDVASAALAWAGRLQASSPPEQPSPV